jgi:2-dehydro-3-deoxygluconokinase
MSGRMFLDIKPVLTFGEPLVVCVPQARGTLATVHDFRTDCAGAELNTAIGLARLQIPVIFAGCVAGDPFGTLIRRALLADSVDVSCLQQTAQGQTGLFFKEWEGLQSNVNVYYYRSTSPMAQGHWDPKEVLRLMEEDKFSWVHATGITWMISSQTRAHAALILQRAYARNIPVSFDVNLRRKLGDISVWRETIKEILPYVTWLFVGDTEAVQLFETLEPVDVEKTVRRQGFNGEGIVIKQGANGATAVTNSKVMRVAAHPVDHVVDTVGAGDGFNAGWIAGTLRGWSIERSLKLAAIVGAYAITSSGDSSGYPSWEAALRELDGQEVIAR